MLKFFEPGASDAIGLRLRRTLVRLVSLLGNAVILLHAGCTAINEHVRQRNEKSNSTKRILPLIKETQSYNFEISRTFAS